MAAAKELKNPLTDLEVRKILMEMYSQKLFQPEGIQKEEFIYLKMTPQIQKLIGRIWTRAGVKGHDLSRNLYLLEYATDKEGFHNERI